MQRLNHNYVENKEEMMQRVIVKGPLLRRLLSVVFSCAPLYTAQIVFTNNFGLKKTTTVFSYQKKKSVVVNEKNKMWPCCFQGTRECFPARCCTEVQQY